MSTQGCGLSTLLGHGIRVFVMLVQYKIRRRSLLSSSNKRLGFNSRAHLLYPILCPLSLVPFVAIFLDLSGRAQTAQTKRVSLHSLGFISNNLLPCITTIFRYVRWIFVSVSDINRVSVNHSHYQLTGTLWISRPSSKTKFFCAGGKRRGNNLENPKRLYTSSRLKNCHKVLWLTLMGTQVFQPRQPGASTHA